MFYVTKGTRVVVNNPKNKNFFKKKGTVERVLDDTGTEEAYIKMDEPVNGVQFIYVATKRLLPATA